MDWNWFYSSAAQSVAAIVGIIAAFVITKIINSQMTFARERIEIKNLINISERLTERANQIPFSSYNWRFRVRQLSGLKERLKKESSFKSAEDYFNEIRFSEYDSKEDIIHEIEEIIQGFKNDAVASLPNYAIASKAELDQERQVLDSILADVKQNARTVSNFLDSIEGNPQSSSLSTVAIVSTLVLFFVGVIYPLSLLPFDNTKAIVFSPSIFLTNLYSTKGMILALVSIIFLCIMLVFLIVNLTLRHKISELQQIRPFTKISAYSKYLGNVESNDQKR